jgi:hypothetical protein
LVDELVNPVPSSVNLVDQLVNLVPSSINLVDQVIDLSTSPVDLVHQVVDLISPSVDPTPPLKSEDVAQVFLVTVDSSRQGGTSPIPMTPPSSNGMISIDWNHLTEPRLPSYMPFEIMVKFCGRVMIPNTIIDEGAFVSILSSNAWQALGSPQLASVTQNLLDFNKWITQPLGILPQLPVTLGGKIVYIDVMVVHDPLDFNFLLGRDYVYAMKALVSTLFRVMCFPHNGNIVTIDQFHSLALI